MKTLAPALLLVLLAGCPEMSQSDAGPNPDSMDAGDLSCRTQGCDRGSWCDVVGGQCQVGCDAADDCTSSETCNTSTHECECAGGYHRCGTTCARNDALTSCGTRCSPCPADPLGTATCSAATCGITCNASALQCGAACAACPAGAATTQCSSAQCVAGSCNAGRLLCQGSCPTCPAGASTTQCSGATCAATACASGRLLCAGQCPSCPVQASATTCSGSGCVATACNPGFALCGGSCVACAPGQKFCCKEAVTALMASGPDQALALTLADEPVIAFQDSQAGSVRLARGGPSGFTVQTLDVGNVGAGVSVAVDATGVAHVAYTKDTFPFALKYARVPLSGAPSVQTITTPTLTTIGDTSIAFDDATGTVHVGAYLNGRGWYAWRQGAAAWQSRYAMFDGNQMAIALSGGVPHLVATSNPSVGVQVSVLSHAVLVDGGLPDGGLFSESTVNSTVGVSVRHDASLAIDDAGVPWVAFQHPSSRNLRLSTLQAGSWVSETVESSPFAGSTSLDWFAGAPHIIWLGTNNFLPRYGVKSGSSWTIIPIDPKPLYRTLRLKVDSTGRPHVTMYDPDPAVRRVVYVH